MPKNREKKPSQEALQESTRSLLTSLVPVANSGWLAHHRPSRALLCCIGSGPWKIGRRATVQEGALRVLGDCDLTERRNELAEYFPLEWQKNLVLSIGRYCHIREGIQFDATASVPTTVVVSLLEASTGKTMYEFPKVLCMYLRDYLEVPIVPRDRHVNDTLRQFRLPLNTRHVTDLFSSVVGPHNVNSYARAIFEKKSSNPKLL